MIYYITYSSINFFYYCKIFDLFIYKLKHQLLCLCILINLAFQEKINLSFQNKMYLCFNKVDRYASKFFICQINFTSMFIFEENIKQKFIFVFLKFNIYVWIILIIKLFNIYLKSDFICFSKTFMVYSLYVQWNNNIHEYIIFKVWSHILNKFLILL